MNRSVSRKIREWCSAEFTKDPELYKRVGSLKRMYKYTKKRYTAELKVRQYFEGLQ